MQVVSLQKAIDMAGELKAAGKVADAENLCRHVVAQLPQSDAALRTLAEMVFLQGRVSEAIGLMRRAIEINPQYSSYYNNLGLLLAATGQFDEAIGNFEKALTLVADTPEVHANLGNAYLAKAMPKRAIEAFRTALSLKPDYFTAALNMAGALVHEGFLDEATEMCRRALELRPDHDPANRLIGRIYRESGRLDEAIAWFEKCITSNPDSKAWGDLLFTQLFHPAYDRRRLFEEADKWNRIHGVPLRSQIRRHENERSRDRRLRVGYFSCDLGDHPLGRFLVPLLANHDHSRFEIFCYCDFERPDEVARRIRAGVDAWRNSHDFSDQQVAEMVRNDRIDILIDLSMQTNGNRMLMLARKPAPVQLSYLAYCGTTGSDAIDYRLTDRFLDLPEWGDEYSSEKPIRLPNCFWCYAAPAQVASVAPLPARQNGHVTFGCLNDFAKVTPEAIRAWCALLRDVPESRLVLHCKQGSHRQSIFDLLARQNVHPERLDLVSFMPIEKYFEQYNQIDIGLDSFPYAGGTTTCDAMWMGVPVVSLAGETGVARGGLSILANIGLPELVASSIKQYLQIATNLASDLPRLEQMRYSMRQRMRSSPLMNPSQFARDVESAYRETWRSWCDRSLGAG
jgi:predicted O-linked N-acetylglucosamine transferase (SPINDLY family)